MSDYGPENILPLCPDCESNNLWLFAYKGVYVNAQGEEEPVAEWLCQDGNLYCRTCDWSGQLSEMEHACPSTA